MIGRNATMLDSNACAEQPRHESRRAVGTRWVTITANGPFADEPSKLLLIHGNAPSELFQVNYFNLRLQ
jgi:hypothetical protein